MCGYYVFIFFYRFQNFVTVQRIFVLKNEILSNIPKEETDPNDLYIHIRSGDPFQNSPNSAHTQPPLCFYEKIIDSFSFRNIYIIAKENNSPVINLLINKYKNIKFIHEDLMTDISYIVNAYNFVTSCSSFSTGLIKLSSNLKMLFEYDVTAPIEKNRYLHYDYQKFDWHFLRIIMKPTENYRNKIYPWKGSKDQINLILTEECKTKFEVMLPKN